VDLSLQRIERASTEIDPVFLGTPQFVDERLSAALGREVLVKVETVNPIGSFKGRGAWTLAHSLEPERTWVCSTAGNFGQGVAYAARARGARTRIFVTSRAPRAKAERMRALGAEVEVCDRPEEAARSHARANDDCLLIVDGLHPEVAEGAGTIGVELATAGPIDTAVVQIGDGALISGVARWLKEHRPGVRIVGVCAEGAPAMARSFAAGHPVRADGSGTIAAPLAIKTPVPESLARVTELVDDIVLVSDDDMLQAAATLRDALSLHIEPAGAAGVAALARHGATIPGERVAVLLTGAGSSD
jgi:threonine dehydratase